MASSFSPLFVALLTIAFLSLYAGNLDAQLDSSNPIVTTDALDWPVSLPSYSHTFDSEEEDDLVGGDADILDGNRRSLFWRRHFAHYYISYAALAADHVPCPPRSGRSYYTHNCHLARGPVCPYTRGCSAITRCRR
ncbi:hypothetical protein HPP92_015527 [Vanilla planifolia]|uniref:Protein RALF-like 34 n=1 Tax=Vanilla planifolia TaxID=51239 RepID=A0A835UTC6_VANPL|nr:hypothetical protein HPP92_016141 [Vanilla planifolia]KAG0470981.1 hypothetical protein HPP92_015527 [Vanilla planifolia]